jgi:DNA-directed RNA polymerase specialized sigma24 family protein
VWLDEGQNSNGRTYLEIRRRLVTYFDRKSCSMPDELADETINRVARKLEELGPIDTDAPAKYCYVTARFVFLEHLRMRARDQQFRADTREESTFDRDDRPGGDPGEKRLKCLDECAAKLDRANRDLIFRYYFGEQRVKINNRRDLASSLGVSVNALSIRACRIRETLELCVRECVSRETN